VGLNPSQAGLLAARPMTCTVRFKANAKASAIVAFERTSRSAASALKRSTACLLAAPPASSCCTS
jgi:hypothetical protein